MKSFLCFKLSSCNRVAAGLAPVAFRGSNQLRDFFRVITTSKDWQGRTFISTMEAKKVRGTRHGDGMLAC